MKTNATNWVNIQQVGEFVISISEQSKILRIETLRESELRMSGKKNTRASTIYAKDLKQLLQDSEAFNGFLTENEAFLNTDKKLKKAVKAAETLTVEQLEALLALKRAV